MDSIYQNIGNKEGQELALMDRLTDENQEEENLMNRMVLEHLLEKLDGLEREIIVRRYFRGSDADADRTGIIAYAGAGIPHGEEDFTAMWSG